MMKIQRQSPVRFAARIEQSEERNNWSIVIRYHDEGHGPWLVDLSHKKRFDLQARNIGEHSPEGAAWPSTPALCTLEDHILVNRMNPTQASIYCLGPEEIDVDGDGAYTDMTEATLFVALFGTKVFRVTEKLTALDFLTPDKQAPFVYQGPFGHVPCQIVTLAREKDGVGGILLSCSRGYAQSMIEAILHAGVEFGLRPAGELRFNQWLEGLELEKTEIPAG